METPGKRLKWARKLKGLSRRLVTQEVGLVGREEVLLQVEIDHRPATEEKVRPWCEFYGLTVSYVLGGEVGNDADEAVERMLEGERELQRVRELAAEEVGDGEIAALVERMDKHINWDKEFRAMVSYKDRFAIVRMAVLQAKMGDRWARAWIYDRQEGRPVERVIQERTSPVLERLMGRWEERQQEQLDAGVVEGEVLELEEVGSG